MEMSKPGPTDPVSVPEAAPDVAVVSVAAVVVSLLELSFEPPQPEAASAA